MDFIREFVSVNKKKTDAPPIYLEACAVALMSAVANGRVYSEFSFGKVYTNLWMILIGPSSTRKTPAINLALKILREVPESKTFLLPNEFSPEELINILSKKMRSRGTFVRDEYSGLLSDLKKEYMSSTKELFMQLYECPDRYERSIKSNPKPYVMRDVYFSILSGITPQNLEAHTSKGDIDSGFIPRFTLIYGERTRFKPIRHENSKDREGAELLVNYLEEISNILKVKDIKFKFTTEALQKYNNYIERNENKAEDGIEKILAGKEQIKLIKLCMLLEMSDNFVERWKNKKFDIYEIRIETLDEAILLLEKWFDACRKLYEILHASKEQKKKIAILDNIKKRGEKGISRSRLLRKSKMSRKNFDSYIETLTEEGLIILELRDKKRYYREVVGIETE